MAFVDELDIHIKAGRGGNGVVRWRHEKGREYMGPAGGNGGKGGDVYARAVRDVSILASYRNKKEFLAENGDAGGSNSKTGRGGDDLYIDLPIGSVIKKIKSGEEISLETEGEVALLARGGNGGLGNEYFKGATNQRPEEWTPGKTGEELDVHIELRLFADVGLVGLPNAGKSSLLNALTRADSKVGAYQFTTLDPHLGDMYGYIIADIPGLIEGAADGKGLGHKFLRHIMRTKVIAHLVSLENEKPVDTYETVRAELEKYAPELKEKKEIVVLSKTDIVNAERLEQVRKEFESRGLEVLTVSVIDDEVLKNFRDTLLQMLK